ncbi:MAG: hypothetical protein A2V96_00530 [Candidatus Yonathbacteria bacterium RBG_16_43_6]|uniref:Lipoprotein n=1 Tax=Candidatus Yonathbacteria bacterium RIFCSPLOWO2_01_FULL_43_27 TaxID=1802726 RepID=A0A1G2SE09_9BACT|nr:MAG: hypothetical protein A2658_00995 [Candidatus Yonathbacteria bacterium RIFCSPHIGHO2_01_FULL_44_19]OHA80136.1 MAG: hypothetical protein A2V96_00530 [Candidatus Yonathbacteria bacterium RBG_16_43_6]OHA83205.1 MAG: hypothetical protein A3B07_00345 [Candidatus Yonathbacteria bacterium RIFCSPLOWO2_01_FULL_43_27]
MKKFLLALFVLAPLVVGCAGTKEITVRSSLAPPGSVAVAPTTTIVVPQQYRIPPVVEEDLLVIQARAIGKKLIKDQQVWDDACFEMRRASNNYLDYDDCRSILGQKPTDERYGHHGRSVGGSVIGNSRGVIWK